MKRSGGAALVAAACLALALSGTALARNPHAGTHGQGHGRGPTTHGLHGNGHGHNHAAGGTDASPTTDAAPVLTDLWVTGSASHPDGTLHVLALVQAPPADRPDTVDAVVHFATGDFPMTLTRSGQGVAYHGDATVPVNEPTGEVAIDVSGDVAGQTLTGTGWGKVLAVGDGSVNATSEDTQGSDGTEGTDGTDGTEDTQGTDGTEGTDGTDGTDGTTTDGDTTGSPDQVVVSADFVRQVIALLESLLA